MTVVVAIAGWAGAAVLLGAYALVSARKLASDGASFQLMNVAGAAGLATHSASNGAWASAVVNLIWIVIGLAAAYRGSIRRTFARRRRAR